MNRFLWGVYPYLCAVLFFVVPVIRMATRPFSWSTRASGMFSRTSLGVASLLRSGSAREGIAASRERRRPAWHTEVPALPEFD